MDSPRNVYAVKVALSCRKNVWREIEVLGNQTLDDLHQTIFTAFDRFDEKLYAFFLTGTSTTSLREVITSPQYVPSRQIPDTGLDILGEREDVRDAGEACLDSLGLSRGIVCYYLFDFGNEWWHELTVTDVKAEQEGTRYPRIAKSNGETPPQYVGMEDE